MSPADPAAPATPGSPGTPTEPTGAREVRLAATVVVVREGEWGPEVLLLRRSSQSRFLPGYLVFPGGALDPEDEDHARRWFGAPEEAARAGAVRELLEEAGLVLTAGAIAPLPPGGERAALAAVDADPPAPDQLRQIARWVAPEDVPVRFDARYFAVPAPRGLEARPDGHETDLARWASPRRVMEEWTVERVRLYWPTMVTMEALAGCERPEDVLALQVPQREPVPGDEERMPRSTFFQDGGDDGNAP